MILSPINLNKAYKKVKSNKGSGGVDGLSVEDLLPYLLEHKKNIVNSIIHKYLYVGVVEKGVFAKTEIGVPQGGPLSPLLSNIMLNELDKELEKRGHKFVRYADDCMILCKSKRAAQRTLTNIIAFIESKLLLKVNALKTVVAHIKNAQFLGYSYYIYKRK